MVMVNGNLGLNPFLTDKYKSSFWEPGLLAEGVAAGLIQWSLTSYAYSSSFSPSSSSSSFFWNDETKFLESFMIIGQDKEAAATSL